jgi:hypothetical protein
MAKAYFEFAHDNLKHFKYRDGNIFQKLFCIGANFQMASLVPGIVVNLLMNKLISQLCASAAQDSSKKIFVTFFAFSISSCALTDVTSTLLHARPRPFC